MSIIPTIAVPFYTQTVALDGINYLLEFRFNSRENTWRMGISLPDGTVLANGIKIVSNFLLLQKYADDRLPQGEIIALSSGPDDSPPGLNDFGVGLRVELCYLERTDLVSGADAWRLPT